MAQVAVYQGKCPTIIQQNAAFMRAMFRARNAGCEHFMTGVRSTPGTESPRFIPHQYDHAERGVSPAQRCVESGVTLALLTVFR